MFELVENWKDAWRWASTRVLLLLAVIPVVWAEMPPEVTEAIPEAYRPWILAVVALGGALGRLRKGKR